MLVQFTKNGKYTKLYRKASVIGLDEKPFCPLMFLVFSNHHPSSFNKVWSFVMKRRKDILSEIKCNLKVTGRLTFDLLTQRSINMAFFSHLSFEHEVQNINNANIQSYYTCENAPFMNHSDLDPQKLTCVCMQVFLLWYCANTNMLDNQAEWIKEQLQM